jgi:hypothetical protein
MNRDLKEWLSEVDADSGPAPAMPADLAGRVLRLARRRGRRRVAAGALAAAAAIVAGAVLWRTPAPQGEPRRTAASPENEPPLPAREVVALRARLAMLDAQGDSASAVASRVTTLLRQGQRLDQLRREASRPGIGVEIDRRMEEAALAAIRGAEQEYRLLNRPQEAAADYERIIRTYPDTAPAQIASQRLAEIRRHKDSSHNLQKEYTHEEACADDRSAGGIVGGPGGDGSRPV